MENDFKDGVKVGIAIGLLIASLLLIVIKICEW